MSAGTGFSHISGYTYFGYECEHCGHEEREDRKRGRTAAESITATNRVRGRIMRHVRDCSLNPERRQ